MPDTSPPAQKAVPAPVMTTAPQRGSSSSVSRVARSAGVRMSPRALRLCGLLRVIVATPSARSQSSSFVPVSMEVIAVCLPVVLGSSLGWFLGWQCVQLPVKVGFVFSRYAWIAALRSSVIDERRFWSTSMCITAVSREDTIALTLRLIICAAMGGLAA